MDIFTNILDSNHLVQNILRSMSSYSSVNDRRSFNGRRSSTGFAFTTKFSIVSFEHRISHDFFFFLSFSLSFRDYNSSLNPLPNLACPSIFQSQLEDHYVLDIYLENIIIIDFKMYRIFFQLLIFSIYNWRIVIHFLIFFVNNDTSTIKAIRTKQTFEFLTYRMKNARNIFSIIIP